VGGWTWSFGLTVVNRMTLLLSPKIDGCRYLFRFVLKLPVALWCSHIYRMVFTEGSSESAQGKRRVPIRSDISSSL